METPAQRCLRIVTALEDLAAQEAAALANRDFAAVAALQERTGPLVDFIVSTGLSYVNTPALRARIGALHDRRNQTVERLASEMARTRADLEQTQVSQRRVAQIAPVYGQSSVVDRRQLQAVG